MNDPKLLPMQAYKNISTSNDVYFQNYSNTLKINARPKINDVV